MIRMLSAIFILLALSITTLQATEKNLNEEHVVGFPIEIRSEQKEVSCEGIYGPVCLDCSTLVTCANNEVNRQLCSNLDLERPYCHNNSCVHEIELTDSCNSRFRCTGPGLFPHPMNCKRYYFCNQAGSVANPYECPPGYVYCSKSGYCRKQQNRDDCPVINCTDNTNKYIIFEDDKAVMAYCAETEKTQETILFKCLDSENMEYDLETLQCKFVCQIEGRFADNLDCKKFYECYETISGYIEPNHQSCHDGYSFHATMKLCLPTNPDQDCHEN